MAKLKRLATSKDNSVIIKHPISSEELLDRHLHYPLLSKRHFAQKFNKLFAPIEFTYNGARHEIQFNYCINPYCSSFGKEQKRYEQVRNKPSRYRLSGKGKGKTQALVCNSINTPIEKGVTQNCIVTPVSNWSVAEEIRRLSTLNTIKDIEPDYVFHKEGCAKQEAEPFNEPKQFLRRGVSTGGSQKWQCKECKKITNVLPEREQKFTYNQKKNEIMPDFTKLLLNRSPVRRTCEILGISPKTYYHKLEWLYRRCLEFLDRYKKGPLQETEFDSIWLNTDKLVYYLNNVRKKGQGGLRYDNLEDKIMQTHILVSGDLNTDYVFRTDVCYDSDISLENLDEDTRYFKEDHLYPFSRKNERLRFPVSPQPPTSNDKETNDEYKLSLYSFQKRNKYIEGLHVNSHYTALAHLWMIKDSLGTSKWRLVSDDDDTIQKGFYRVFNKEISAGTAHHFLCKVNREKSLQDAYRENKEGFQNLKDWGIKNGFTNHSIKQLASQKVISELNSKPLFKTLSKENGSYKIWARNEVEHPLPPSDKGYYSVDCTTDVSSLDTEHLANLLLKVSDRTTNNFMQVTRRRLSFLERPLVTARGGGKSYIYANFNPKYAQMAITILRTYYNFCLPIKIKGGSKKSTPAQHLGITKKKYSIEDILYFK